MKASDPCPDPDDSGVASTTPGSIEWYSVLFATEEHKNILEGLHGFRIELRHSVQRVSEADIARFRLGWWREEIDRYRRGEPMHPVSKKWPAFSSLNDDTGTALTDMIDAACAEVALPRFADIDGLFGHCRMRGGSFLQLQGFWLAAGIESERLRELGAAFSLVEMMRDVRPDLAAGQVFLPLQWIDDLGLDIAGLSTGTPARNALALMSRIGDYAGQVIDRHCAPAMSHPVLAVETTLYRRVLSNMRRDNYRTIFSRRVETSGIAVLWAAWRAAVNARLRRHTNKH